MSIHSCIPHSFIPIIIFFAFIRFPADSVFNLTVAFAPSPLPFVWPYWGYFYVVRFYWSSYSYGFLYFVFFSCAVNVVSIYVILPFSRFSLFWYLRRLTPPLVFFECLLSALFPLSSILVFCLPLVSPLWSSLFPPWLFHSSWLLSEFQRSSFLLYRLSSPLFSFFSVLICFCPSLVLFLKRNVSTSSILEILTVIFPLCPTCVLNWMNLPLKSTSIFCCSLMSTL